MKPDPFEQRLSAQPLRPIPSDWREAILAEARTSVRPAASSIRSSVTPARHWLSEWLWPHPVAWAGLAACWVAILVLNQAAAPNAVELAQARQNARVAAAYFAMLRSSEAMALTAEPRTPTPVTVPRRRSPDQGRLDPSPTLVYT